MFSTNLLRGVEYRAVSRAPAEVSIEGVFDLFRAEISSTRLGVGEERVQRHDNARRTVAALRPVRLGNELLCELGLL